MKGEQQKIFHKGSNRKINAFITLLYPSNKIKFKISKSRTSNDFIDHLRSIGNYVKNNKIKRFILVTDNASYRIVFIFVLNAGCVIRLVLLRPCFTPNIKVHPCNCICNAQKISNFSYFYIAVDVGRR